MRSFLVVTANVEEVPTQGHMPRLLGTTFIIEDIAKPHM